MTDVLSISHADLVKLAVRWLRYRQRCPVVFAEMSSGETPDAIGWYGARSILVECKVSRNDFFANQKKQNGVGMGEQRWFATRQGLVAPAEVPSTWGLLEWDGSHFRQTVKAVKRVEYARHHEIGLLISALRRIGVTAKGVSVKVYTTQTKNTAQAFIEVEGQVEEDAG
jgi:hypothetical protein